MRSILVPAALGVAIAGPAWAQDADCSGFKWSMNRELAAFKTEGLPSVSSGSAVPGMVEAVQLKLAPQESVAFSVAPAHKPRHTPAYGGTFSLPPIASADTYQFTISDDAWIDVVQNGKALKQVGFTGSHSCKVVHKSVRFMLAAGPATIEISDAASDNLKLEVLPKEQ